MTLQEPIPPDIAQQSSLSLILQMPSPPVVTLQSAIYEDFQTRPPDNEILDIATTSTAPYKKLAPIKLRISFSLKTKPPNHLLDIHPSHSFNQLPVIRASSHALPDKTDAVEPYVIHQPPGVQPHRSLKKLLEHLADFETLPEGPKFL